MEIRALRTSDDRSAFQSGDEALDRFFHRYAGQNQFRHYLGVRLLGLSKRSRRQPARSGSIEEDPPDVRPS